MSNGDFLVLGHGGGVNGVIDKDVVLPKFLVDQIFVFP
jgi:hypothetical protein